MPPRRSRKNKSTKATPSKDGLQSQHPVPQPLVGEPSTSRQPVEGVPPSRTTTPTAPVDTTPGNIDPSTSGQPEQPLFLSGSDRLPTPIHDFQPTTLLSTPNPHTPSPSPQFPLLDTTMDTTHIPLPIIFPQSTLPPQLLKCSLQKKQHVKSPSSHAGSSSAMTAAPKASEIQLQWLLQMFHVSPPPLKVHLISFLSFLLLIFELLELGA